LDLNVMFCDAPVGIPAEQLDRAVSLPAGARRVFSGASTGSSRAYLDQLARFTDKVTACTYVLMIARVVAVGGETGSAAAVAAALRRMLRYRSVEYAATPRLVYTERRHGRAANVIFTHGRDFAEVAGGRYTLTTRLSGAGEQNGASRVSAPVACGSGVLLIPRAMLKRAVTAAIDVWDASFAEWKLPIRTVQSTHAVMDVALAALRLPAVQAVPVSMSIAVSKWDTAWETYANFSADAARGGTELDGVLSGLNDLLPRALTFDSSRGSDARRANTAAEQKVAENATLYWELPYVVACDGCNGFTVEATNSMLAAEARLQTRAVVFEHCWCPGMLPYQAQAVARMRQPKAGSGVERYGDVPEAPRRTDIWVSHTPPAFLATFPYGNNSRATHNWRGLSTREFRYVLSATTEWPLSIQYPQRPSYVVARLMIEVDRIDAGWVAVLNSKDVDEMWVPAAFLVDAFYKSGVHLSRRIFVVPDGIDHHAYDAAVVKPSPLIVDDERYEGHYKFFSNFKWEPRKGWDILLKAYFAAFTREDKVVLFIKTFMFDELDRSLWHDQAHADRRFRNYTRDVLKLDPERQPPVVLLVGAMPAAAMMGLYRAADCYVLPTRGEGSGLPFQEAMAMGLPTIGTNWGGNIQFMNATNSLLIDIEGLEDPMNATAPLLPVNDTSQRMKPYRARPSMNHTAQLMRWAFGNPGKARAIGAVAREHIARYFSLEAHGQMIVDRVADIARLRQRA
jgi:glycosyltransferase involved in cell wall biosynthesis